MFPFPESGEIIITKLLQQRQRININIRQSLLRMANRLSIFTLTYCTHLVHGYLPDGCVHGSRGRDEKRTLI